MSSDTENLYKMVERLESKQEKTNEALTQLADKIGDLVTTIARKEVHDENTGRRLSDIENRLTNHGKRIQDVETVQAGQQAERKILDYFIKPAIALIVVAIIGGALYAFGLKNG